MAKKIQARNLRQLKQAVKGIIHDGMYFSSNLQDKSAEFMQESIIENVYDAYNPSSYDRRGNEDGFSDMDNIEVTSIENRKYGLGFIIENTTEKAFSKNDKTLTEIFEEGHKDSWHSPNAIDDEGRIVSEARPFIDKTIEKMQQNKGELQDALAKDLTNLGFKVRKR